MNLKQTYDTRASLHAQMTAIVDKAKRANRKLSAEENDKFDRMDAEMIALTGDIERFEKHEAHELTMNALQPIALDNINSDPRSRAPKMQKDPYTKVFGKYLRVGMGGMDPAEQSMMRTGFDAQAALSPSTGSTGGYVVPQGFEDNLDTAKKWFGGIDQFCDVVTTDTGAPLPWPTSNDTTNMGEIVGPNTQVSQAVPTFGQVMFGAYKFSSKLVLVPIELLQDSAFDFDEWIPQQLGTRIARIQNNKFTVGVGGGTEPTGLVTAVAASGNVVTLPNGNTASLPVTGFYSLEAAVDPSYRQGARYMLSDTTLTLVKKLQDSTGRPLWQPGISATFADGAPDKINGYQYIINNDMPNPGASNYLMAFGAYKEFKVRRVKGYMVLRLTERYADYGQVGFLCFERADSNYVDAGTHPIALLQNSAT